jgi:hypothetical protein
VPKAAPERAVPSQPPMLPVRAPFQCVRAHAADDGGLALTQPSQYVGVTTVAMALELFVHNTRLVDEQAMAVDDSSVVYAVRFRLPLTRAAVAANPEDGCRNLDCLSARQAHDRHCPCLGPCFKQGCQQSEKEMQSALDPKGVSSETSCIAAVQFSVPVTIAAIVSPSTPVGVGPLLRSPGKFSTPDTARQTLRARHGRDKRGHREPERAARDGDTFIKSEGTALHRKARLMLVVFHENANAKP